VLRLARNRVSPAEPSSKVVPIAVAAIGAAGGIVAALIVAAGGGTEDQEAKTGAAAHSPTATATATSLSAGTQLEFTSMSRDEIGVPPAERLTFEGHAPQLGPGKYVVILGQLDAPALAAPKSSLSQSAYVVSPVAAFSGDGTWRVTWVPDAASKIVAFTPIVAATTAQGLVDTKGPSLSELLDLKRNGPNSGLVVEETPRLSPAGVPLPP
jgi:hypothetical protein